MNQPAKPPETGYIVVEEYIVVEYDNHAEFCKRVEAMIDEGWQLQGGVSVTVVPWNKDNEDMGTNEYWYHQAMIRTLRL